MLRAAMLLAVLLGQASLFAPVPAVTGAGLRGLAVVSTRVAWASGTHGTYLRTLDGGTHWVAAQVPGASGLDFRDVKAFDGQTAYLVAIANHGGIFKTRDGGAHWQEVYTNSDPKFFLDGIAFWDRDHGVALGDPMAGHFLLLRTSDGGASWTAPERLPDALPGEGAFAASGTTLVVGPRGRAWFATGGVSGARVFRSTDSGRTWTATLTPMSATKVGTGAGAGIFSLAFRSLKDGVAVGGDYTHPDDSARTVALTHDGGQSWQLETQAPPGGYRSAVAYAPGHGGQVLVAVGPSGADISRDGGRTWAAASSQGFNSIGFAPSGPGWAAGAHGRLARVAVP